MTSPRSKRNSCRGSVCGNSGVTANGRFEIATLTRNRSTPECHARRRSSVPSNCHSAAHGGDDFAGRLKQPIFSITLRFLLAIDLWLSKKLGVCACEESSWGSIRPLVRLVELSGHPAPWLIGTLYSLLRGDTVMEQEIMLNLALALLMDLLLVRAVKTAVRRRRPAQNRSDILSAFFVERYCFPSGHATRAALCARFLLARLVDAASVRARALVLGWAGLVSLSRLLLARHYVTDVGFGLAMGYCQYGLVERLWVTWDCLERCLLALLGPGRV